MQRLMLVVMLLLLPWPVAAMEVTGAPGHDRITADSGDTSPAVIRSLGVHEALLRTLGRAPERSADPTAGPTSLPPRAHPSPLRTGTSDPLTPAHPEGSIPLCERLPFYPTAPPPRQFA